MSGETIELAKNFSDDIKHDKLIWPAMAQEKLDGVPVIIMRESPDKVTLRTRPGELVTSLTHIANFARFLIPAVGDFVVGEVYCSGMAFKDISGLVRQKLTTKECLSLSLYLFDGGLGSNPEMDWYTRRTVYDVRLNAVCSAFGVHRDSAAVQLIAGALVSNPDEVQQFWTMLKQCNPKAEGVMLHSTRKIWNPGKRCWGLQRIKQEDTIDLRIVGFEEAVNQRDEPMGMVGRMIAEYSTVNKDGKLEVTHIGIGPGRTTILQRKQLWTSRGTFKPRIAEIKFKPDETYTALREPTFQRWRDDKKEPNIGQ